MISTSYELNAAIKGVIEGFTEFLPISSTGHLVLVRDLFPLTSDPARVQELDNLFDVVIQLPAILAIVILFWRRLLNSTMGVLSSGEARNFWISVISAFIPAAIIGFALSDKIDLLMQPQIVAYALLIGGVVILAIERWGVAGAIARAEEVPVAKALRIGLFQCLSIIPGTSRSGATIIGGRFFGLNRIAAAEFSFFLALPTMLGAFTLKFTKDFHHIVWSTDGPILLIGSISSFLTAWVVVALFIKYIQKYSLSVFGWYRIILGTLILFFSASAGS